MARQKATKTTRAERLRRATQKRREAEKQHLHQTILEAASELFLEHGYENFSLRHVAEEIGYSPGTIYLYFKDKEELLFALAEEGFTKFGQQLATAAASTDDPKARLTALCHAYFNFGVENPTYYQLMFMQRTEFLVEAKESDFETRTATFGILQNAVEAAMAAGVIRPDDSLRVSDALWALVHGIVSLAICMPFFFDEARRQQALAVALELSIDGLRPS